MEVSSATPKSTEKEMLFFGKMLHNIRLPTCLISMIQKKNRKVPIKVEILFHKANDLLRALTGQACGLRGSDSRMKCVEVTLLLEKNCIKRKKKNFRKYGKSIKKR
jgi:hypothetical protein